MSCSLCQPCLNRHICPARRTLGGKGSGSTTGDPIIPKRGEKDFEPASEDRYVNLQTSLLDASRAALFTAISSGSRHHSSRAHNRAVWDASLSKAYMVHVEDPALPCRAPVVAEEATGKPVPQATTHGVHFLTMGRHEPARKRLELLPEEALYLLERGTIECWTGEDETAVPMSLQHAWCQMIHAGELNAERYQVRVVSIVRLTFSRLTRSSSATGLRLAEAFGLHGRQSGLPSTSLRGRDGLTGPPVSRGKSNEADSPAPLPAIGGLVAFSDCSAQGCNQARPYGSATP